MSPMSTDLDMSQQGPPGEGWTQSGDRKSPSQGQNWGRLRDIQLSVGVISLWLSSNQNRLLHSSEQILQEIVTLDLGFKPGPHRKIVKDYRLKTG